ncbi:hypothetical protein M5K25_002416 [Dendrobium thyrsiflorum]|uniref:Uncharacterized protein n=1 Tax=Dendrobium thyrsiflorum TaxID=117978 RepID=A0ABD0VM96_DENTH
MMLWPFKATCQMMLEALTVSSGVRLSDVSKPPGSEGPGHDRLSMVPFGDKTFWSFEFGWAFGSNLSVCSPLRLRFSINTAIIGEFTRGCPVAWVRIAAWSSILGLVDVFCLLTPSSHSPGGCTSKAYKCQRVIFSVVQFKSSACSVQIQFPVQVLYTAAQVKSLCRSSLVFFSLNFGSILAYPWFGKKCGELGHPTTSQGRIWRRIGFPPTMLQERV